MRIKRNGVWSKRWQLRTHPQSVRVVMKEIWKDVESVTFARRLPHFKKGRYQISNLGRVKDEWGLLKLSPDGRGYLGCGLGKIHVLVAEAFCGPRPQGHEVHHIDGNKTNNVAMNLQWITRSKHKLAHGKK